MSYVLPGNRRNQHTKYWLRILYSGTKIAEKGYLRVLENGLRVNTAKYSVGMRVSGLRRISRFKQEVITGAIYRVEDVIGRIEYLVNADDGKRYWILEDDIQVLSITVRTLAIVPPHTHELAA